MRVHVERRFEDVIEADLLASGGWTKGDPHDFDAALALFPKHLFDFIEATQIDLWTDLLNFHGAGTKMVVLDALEKALESRGMLDVLRHGFKVMGKRIDGAFFRPAHGLNPDILAKYAANRLVVTRQVRFAPGRDESVDLVLSLNGFPIATAELKNPATGQNHEHAVGQYRERDPKHRLFQWKKRALVHFAVDPDVAFMTTCLAGKDTAFLPFNRGKGEGAGNPPDPSGFATAYLWREVWARESFLDVLARFLHVLKEEKEVQGRKVTRESIIFPRYHQLDAVRRLEAAARADGPGKSYLVQHSAGSGKSNSIAWLAHRLASLHDARDERVFDSVVVVTDRRVLDRQLQDTIYQFEHKQGVVARIDEDSGQLAEALAAGTPIIITTLQKFPFVAEKVEKLPGRTYAVIVDEAHSSQTGEAARNLKEVLAARDLEEAAKTDGESGGEDAEDRLVAVMKSRGRQKNLSYFAFTATPKYKTLELFGHRGPDGKPAPFHLYSMRQAIEEGFILDVLKHYTTYKAFWKLAKKSEDDPRFNKGQASSALARFMSLHPHNLAQKTEVMVEHYRTKVRHRIGGKAKAMLVTASRLHAVRYRQAFEKYLAEKGYTDIGVLVAFSGKVRDPDVSEKEYTEPGMNIDRQTGKQIREKELPERFASGDYHLLIVAEKYQTGFDQPLLHTMYVDKRLSGVQAVQTLSRLNRTHPEKAETFVLDFVNEAEEIERSFAPYYRQTTIAEAADPSQLYDLQHRLEEAQVFWKAEVESFATTFYKPRVKQAATDLGALYAAVQPALDRFKPLEDEAKDQFRNALSGFVQLYAFLSQIMPFNDPDLEKLYSFGRFLELKLPRDSKNAPLGILFSEVALHSYRLSKVTEGSVPFDVGPAKGLKGPTDVGTRKAIEEEASLSEIIEILNERFGTTFARADQLFFDQSIAEAKSDEEIAAWAKANSFDNFSIAAKRKILGAIADRLDSNERIVTRIMNDAEFQEVAIREMAKRVYEEVRRGA